MKAIKPLGQKAYGHIPHLPGSRMGPGDHRCHDGQARICCGPVVKGQRPDRHDRILVQEKLDGSCTSVARVGDEIIALGRAGYPAQSSPYEQHQFFAAWVREREGLFRSLLEPGERLVGEWLAQAHGTRYDLRHDPWVVFDLMVGTIRAVWDEVTGRLANTGLVPPRTVSIGEPVTIEQAMALVGSNPNFHGAIDPIEGAVWRVERDNAVDFLAKYVRPDKLDGCYLPEITKGEAVWNWRPMTPAAPRVGPERL